MVGGGQGVEGGGWVGGRSNGEGNCAVCLPFQRGDVFIPNGKG